MSRNMNAKVRQPIIDKIVENIRLGAPLVVACSVAGISRATFSAWRTDDSSIDEQLKAAQGDFETAHLRNIRNHSAEDWKASAWVLERRVPHRYAKKLILNGTRIETDTGLLVQVPAPPKDSASLEDIATLKEELARAQEAFDKANAARAVREGAADVIQTGQGD